MFVGDLWREAVGSLFKRKERTRAVTTAMSGAPVTSTGVVDDVGGRLDSRRLAPAIMELASAERAAERGWDWDSTVPDALFYGQSVNPGPTEARVRVEAAEAKLARAADLFGSSVEWSKDLA